MRETSMAALRRIRKCAPAQRRRILGALAKSRHGLTDEQLVDAAGLAPSSLRPRRGELERDGFVADSGRQRPTRSGRLAVVWTLGQRYGRPLAPQRAARVLRRFNSWRRGANIAQPDALEIGQAIDAAVSALLVLPNSQKAGRRNVG